MTAKVSATMSLPSTADLIEAALAEELRDDNKPVPNLVALHERGTREVLDAAIKQCHSPDPIRRIVGARILGELGSPSRTFPEECCDALLELVRHDNDERVFKSALIALNHLRNARCEPDIIALRHNPDSEVRYFVASHLWGTKSDAGAAALLELMQDSSPVVRDWATTGIGHTIAIDGPEIRDALLRNATDEDEITRAEAMHGLARRHDARVVPLLIAEMSRNGEHVDDFACAAEDYLGV
jgi:HEAT repeat protein